MATIINMLILSHRYLSYYWVLTWKISTPLLLSCVLVATLLDYHPAKEGDYVFPAWANGVGWGVAISSLLAVLPLSGLEVLRALLSGLPLSSLVTPCRVHRDTVTNMAITSSTDNLVEAAYGEEEMKCDIKY